MYSLHSTVSRCMSVCMELIFVPHKKEKNSKSRDFHMMTPGEITKITNGCWLDVETIRSVTLI